MSALRGKRGLRCVNGAEPQIVGLTPQTTDERKTDPMKTYILRDPKSVEPQISIRTPSPKPTGSVNSVARLRRPETTAKGPSIGRVYPAKHRVCTLVKREVKRIGRTG